MSYKIPYASRNYDPIPTRSYNPFESGPSLEYLVGKSEHKPIFEQKYQFGYSVLSKGTHYGSSQYVAPLKVHKTYHFPVESFLNKHRKQAPTIQAEDSIHGLIEEAFLSTTNKKLPRNISISICSRNELEEIHAAFGPWDEGIQGFVVPGTIHRIFVRNGALDEVMLILGHEIGHIHTKQLPNIHDEEAKAFSFSIEWANKIREHNIGDLQENIK